MRLESWFSAAAALGAALAWLSLSNPLTPARAADNPPPKPKPAAAAASKSPARYVGSKKCASCHEENYGRYVKYSKKSRSYRSIRRMQRGLTAAERRDCYRCHTTAYGLPGGFVSLAETPHQQNVGCEACHGPGSRHVKSEDKKDITRQVPNQRCKSCHVSARIKAFHHVPLTYGGAH
ncbi:MAG: cytochrome c family protein [Proteobacteria bacterium]|nr:cytochrome c family protein [Pseudomonadota bacterium]MBU1742103.1 cytochrome c family protein [Pseudomonadota bacterium]